MVRGFRSYVKHNQKVISIMNQQKKNSIDDLSTLTNHHKPMVFPIF